MPAELSSGGFKQGMTDSMTAIHNGPLGPLATYGNSLDDTKSATPSFDPYRDELGDKLRMLEVDPLTANAYNKKIDQLWMLLNDALTKAKVVGRVKEGVGNPILRTSHSNLLQDTQVHEVKSTDGNTAEYATNLITMVMFVQQVDNKGQSYQILDKIVDH
jgi:hypothetical protein